MTELEKAARMALEALEYIYTETTEYEDELIHSAITALRRALEQPASGIKQVIELYDSPEQPAQDNTYRYAKSLAEAIFKQHFASDEHYASGRVVWGVNDTVIGILTQIDNMVADMVRRPAQQEPVAWPADMLERIDAAIKRITSGHGLMRVPPDKTDPDLVLAEIRNLIKSSRPQAREWVGLTDEQIGEIGRKHEKFAKNGNEWFDRWTFARAIEAKLKEKNT